MTIDLTYAACAVVLTWIMVFSASVWKARAWTPAGMKLALGNRADVPEPTGAVARAGRAATNMLENLPLYLGLVMVAHLGDKANSTVMLGAHLWFWSRVAYWPIYLVGIPVVRTLVWWVSIGGLAVMFAAIVV